MARTMSKSLTTTKAKGSTRPTALQRPHGGWSFRGRTTHPGVILQEDFLKPMGLSQHRLAMKIRVPATRIGDIVHGRRGVTPETALRLSRFFGNSAEFWLNLQQMHDLSETRIALAEEIEREIQAPPLGKLEAPMPV